MTSAKVPPPVWQRNLLFAVICLAGVVAVVSDLLQSDTMNSPRDHEPREFQNASFEATVQVVDNQFEANWARAGLKPMQPADELTLVRRLSLGLTGTIPSLEEIRELEKQPEGTRVQWWLSHLFEDRRTSDHLAERFARATVGVENGPFLIYRRRRFVSWLSDEIHVNRPYDRIVRSLITAKGLWTNNPEVNFVTVTIDQNENKGPDEAKLAARVTRAFLGVRIDCVQCHDDYLGDDWLQKDFHQLASFFGKADMTASGIHETDKPYVFKYRGASETNAVPPQVPFSAELLPEEGHPRRRLADWVTHKENRAFARATVNRVWALMFGRPLVTPVDQIPLQATTDKPFPPGLETLADDFITNNYDLRRLIRVIAATRVFQLDSEGAEPPTDQHDAHWAAFGLTRLRPEQVAGSILQAASLKPIDANAHIIWQLSRSAQRSDFIKLYGDVGGDEFSATGGTIPQRLLLMNGNMVHERIKDNIVVNAATRILATARDNPSAVEAAYLVVLSRRPSPKESAHFVAALDEGGRFARRNRMSDLYWALLNSTEFSWNH